MMKGHAFYQLGNEESALENYTLAEKYKAVSPNFLHMFIGFNEISKGHWEEGYRHLELVIHSKDTDSTMLPSLYAHVAICLYNLGEKRQADLFFKKAHEIGPKDAEPYLIEGGMYMEKGDFDKAVKKWALALECAPCADTWNEIGMSSMETGHIQYAQTAFEQVKKLEPDFENINEKLTALYLLLDDMENFLKYNQLCAHPFQAKDLENMLDLLDCKNRDEMIKRVKEVLYMESSAELIKWVLENLNYWVVTIFMTIESSFIPFPSEVIVPPAACKAMTDDSMNIFLVVIFATIGADLGALINYYLARWLGRPIVYKFANSRFGHMCLIDEAKVRHAEEYFRKHGAASTFFGRLIPAVRQLISIPAGLAGMKLGSFLLYTTLGAGIWNTILALLGYFIYRFTDIKTTNDVYILATEYSHEIGYIILAVAIFVVGFLIYKGIKQKK